MSDPIDIYAVGSPVLLDTGVSARVTAVFIRKGRITYEVVWWNDRKREEEIVEPWEIQPDNEETRKQRVNPVL